MIICLATQHRNALFIPLALLYLKVCFVEQEGHSVDHVKGVCFRRGDSVVQNEEAPIVNNLSDFPSPHLHRYTDCTDRIICVETQRGCVFRCNFCFYNKDYSVRNRRFDLDRVKEEIRFWLEQDVKQLYLMDPVFNLNGERARLAWPRPAESPDPDGDTFKRFIDHVCGEHAIPPEFYRRFATLEFA